MRVEGEGSSIRVLGVGFRMFESVRSSVERQTCWAAALRTSASRHLEGQVGQLEGQEGQT